MAGFCRKIAVTPARRRLGERGRRRPRHPGRDPPGRGACPVEVVFPACTPAASSTRPTKTRPTASPAASTASACRSPTPCRTASRSGGARRQAAPAGVLGRRRDQAPSPASATPQRKPAAPCAPGPTPNASTPPGCPGPSSNACSLQGRADARPRGQPRHRGGDTRTLALRAGMRGYLSGAPTDDAADPALRGRKYAAKGDETFAVGEG